MQEGATAPAQELFEKLSNLPASILQISNEDFAAKIMLKTQEGQEWREKICR
jgi:hypothetical protein